MSNTAGWISLIYMLTSRTWSSHKLKLKILWINFEIIWDLRHNNDNASWAVHSTSFFSFWNSLYFMDSSLMFEMSKHLIASNFKYSIFATFSYWSVWYKFYLLHLPSLNKSIPLIHFHHVFCKEGRFRPSHRMFDFESTVSLISFVFG